MAEIEKIYRVRIYYEGGGDVIDAVEDLAFRLGAQLEVESFTGCPACGPYLTAEAEEEAPVAIWADNVEQFIQRYKGATLQP